MMETTEADLGTKFANAVVMVTADFDDSLRQATNDAGNIALVNVLRNTINELTAAVISYEVDRKGSSQAQRADP